MASPVRASLGLATVVLAVPLAALAFGSFQGCTVLSNDDPLDEGGTYDGGEAGPDAALDCNECVIGSCSGEWSTCFASADCVSVLACVAAADSATAQTACACGSATGTAVLAMARRCDAPQRCGAGLCNAACAAADATTDCKSPSPTCGGGADAGDAGNTTDASSDSGSTTDGGITAMDGGDAGDAGPAPVTAASCNTCIAQHCNDQKQQCPSGSDCDAFLTCSLQCTSAACVTECGTNHPTGKQASAQLAMCVNVSCQPECGL
jgi:hypothetical protein